MAGTERTDTLRKAADKHVAAMSEANRSMTALWRSQMELAIALGDDDAVTRAMEKDEVAIWDNNTNCPCDGGGTSTA